MKGVRYASVMAVAGSCVLTIGSMASAQPACQGLPTHAQLKAALAAAVSAETSGLNNQMWATIVNRDGIVCAVAFSGADRVGPVADQPRHLRPEGPHRQRRLPGQRVVQQRIRTADRPGPLHRQPLLRHPAGGSLYGLQHSNPVDAAAAYKGPASAHGAANDPMVGARIGGVNVFGGGLGLYNSSKKVVGGVGVSGDTSCADHNIAWRVRHELGLDNLSGVGGVSGDPSRPDNIVFDITAEPRGRHRQQRGRLRPSGLPQHRGLGRAARGALTIRQHGLNLAFILLSAVGTPPTGGAHGLDEASG